MLLLWSGQCRAGGHTGRGERDKIRGEGRPDAGLTSTISVPSVSRCQSISIELNALLREHRCRKGPQASDNKCAGQKGIWKPHSSGMTNIWCVCWQRFLSIPSHSKMITNKKEIPPCQRPGHTQWVVSAYFPQMPCNTLFLGVSIFL